MSSRTLRLVVTLLGALTWMGSSCLNPCEQLAQKICSCEPTQFERDTCTQQASTQQQQRGLDNDARLRCQEYLGTCECRDLREGRIEACGLSRE